MGLTWKTDSKKCMIAVERKSPAAEFNPPTMRMKYPTSVWTSRLQVRTIAFALQNRTPLIREAKEQEQDTNQSD